MNSGIWQAVYQIKMEHSASIWVERVRSLFHDNYCLVSSARLLHWAGSIEWLRVLMHEIDCEAARICINVLFQIRRHVNVCNTHRKLDEPLISSAADKPQQSANRIPHTETKLSCVQFNATVQMACFRLRDLATCATWIERDPVSKRSIHSRFFRMQRPEILAIKIHRLFSDHRQRLTPPIRLCVIAVSYMHQRPREPPNTRPTKPSLDRNIHGFNCQDDTAYGQIHAWDALVQSSYRAIVRCGRMHECTNDTFQTSGCCFFEFILQSITHAINAWTEVQSQSDSCTTLAQQSGHYADQNTCRNTISSASLAPQKERDRYAELVALEQACCVESKVYQTYFTPHMRSEGNLL